MVVALVGYIAVVVGGAFDGGGTDYSRYRPGVTRSGWYGKSQDHNDGQESDFHCLVYAGGRHMLMQLKWMRAVGNTYRSALISSIIVLCDLAFYLAVSP